MEYLKERCEFSVQKALDLIELPRATFFRWKKAGGKEKRRSVVAPKSNYLLESEKEAIIAFKRQNPEVGYKKLAYMMLDADVAAVSPASVYNVLKQAGLNTKWTCPGVAPSRKGFDQPNAPHEQWHTDISYLNILGTHYFFISVLDGYSRSIVHHEVRPAMTTHDVTVVVDRALSSLSPETPRPRIISDNGGQYISADFKSYLRLRQITHSRIKAGHPQSNGKIERFHQSLKSECVRVKGCCTLEEASTLISQYVTEYNTKRLHAALNYLTPYDYLQGEAHIKKMLETRNAKLKQGAMTRKKAWKQVEFDKNVEFSQKVA